MAKYLHHTRFVILIGLVMSTHAQFQGFIRNPYLYQNQTQRCNCEPNEQCNDRNGTCPSAKCASPYFGVNCQHADVRLSMTTADQTNVPADLLDSDDTTCVSAWSGTASFRIEKPVYFIWIYIFKKHSVTNVRPWNDWMTMIDVTLGLGSNRQRASMYVLKISENSLLIKSRKDVLYDHVSVHYLPRDLCSLEVSLGRNLASSSTPTGVQNALGAIDGSEKYTRRCPVLEQTPYDNQAKEKWWSTRLLHDARISNIQIVGTVDRCQGFHFHFDFTTTTGKVITRFPGAHDEILPVVRGRTRINVADLNALVRKVAFFLGSCSMDDAIAMYEIYIFGEFHCPKDKYGAQCERHCPNGCEREKCDPDWGCLHGCNQGWAGRWCDQSLSSDKPGASKSSMFVEWSLYLTLAVIGVLLVVGSVVGVYGRFKHTKTGVPLEPDQSGQMEKRDVEHTTDERPHSGEVTPEKVLELDVTSPTNDVTSTAV